jgi:hypothetical protein
MDAVAIGGALTIAVSVIIVVVLAIRIGRLIKTTKSED